MSRATSKLSEHLSKEIEHTVRLDHRPEESPPLEPGQPVPGCICYQCVIGSLGLEDDARFIAEDLVRDLSRLDSAIRRSLASSVVESWLAKGLRLPSAGILTELAGRVEGARRSRPIHTDQLPLEAARAVPILAVAERLGLNLQRKGKSWRGPCPIHDGNGPNFSIDPERGIFKCFVCGAAGDAIELEQEVAGVGFADAVRRLAK